MRSLAEQIVDAGDAALLLPIAGVIFVACWLSGAVRTTFAWAVAIGFCGLASLLLKIAVYYRADPALVGTLSSPSGHAALSTVVYGSLASTVSAATKNRPLQFSALLAAGCLVAAIGVASVVIGAHTPAEIAIGTAVGAVSVMTFRMVSRREYEQSLPTRLLGVLVLILFAALYGRQLDAEAAIRRVGVMLHQLSAASRQEHPRVWLAAARGTERASIDLPTLLPNVAPNVDEAGV